MLEELLRRRKKEKLVDANTEVPDIVKAKKSNHNRTHSSSITVKEFLFKRNLIIAGIVVVGVCIIGLFCSSLIIDFLTYSSGELSISTP